MYSNAPSIIVYIFTICSYFIYTLGKNNVFSSLMVSLNLIVPLVVGIALKIVIKGVKKGNINYYWPLNLWICSCFFFYGNPLCILLMFVMFFNRILEHGWFCRHNLLTLTPRSHGCIGSMERARKEKILSVKDCSGFKFQCLITMTILTMV